MTRTNAFGQPIGEPLPDWRPPPPPPRTPMIGRYCRVEPVDADVHAADLFEAYAADRDGVMFTYLGYEPFGSSDEVRAWVRAATATDDPLVFAIVDTSGTARGVASHLRINPANGVIEVGGIALSPALQRTAAATEAMALMMARAFELGYRRYEWKCDSFNAPSRRAAERLGFTYEGTFRQAIVYKGRNRDTAWYSILDREWATLKRAYDAWLDPANFDGDGRQRARLADLIFRESPG